MNAILGNVHLCRGVRFGLLAACPTVALYLVATFVYDFSFRNVPLFPEIFGIEYPVASWLNVIAVPLAFGTLIATGSFGHKFFDEDRRPIIKNWFISTYIIGVIFGVLFMWVPFGLNVDLQMDPWGISTLFATGIVGIWLCGLLAIAIAMLLFGALLVLAGITCGISILCSWAYKGC